MIYFIYIVVSRSLFPLYKLEYAGKKIWKIWRREANGKPSEVVDTIESPWGIFAYKQKHFWEHFGPETL